MESQLKKSSLLDKSLKTCQENCDHKASCSLKEVNLDTFYDKIIQELKKSYTKEISEFAHVLRHDIRNFIAAIDGYSYLLKDEFEHDYLEKIKQNSMQIGELINRSLDLADSGLIIDTENSVDLNHILDSCRKIVPDSINFKFEKLEKVRGDHPKILIIFRNLLENAMVSGKPTKIHIKVKYTDDSYIIRVYSNGKVYTEESVQNLFNMPQSFKKNQNISLYVVYKLIEAHNWKIRCIHDLNETCFEIEIPIKSVSS